MNVLILENIGIWIELVVLIVLLIIGYSLFKSMTQDGHLTVNEVSKIVIIAISIYMTVINAKRPINTSPVFDTSTYFVVLSSLLLLGGIDLLKVRNFLDNKDDKDKNSTDSK